MKDSKNKNIKINDRHVELFNDALDTIEILLKNSINELNSTQIPASEISKNFIAVLDFIISSLGKIQKGQRLALNMDKENPTEYKEPKINVIKGVDYKKI